MTCEYYTNLFVFTSCRASYSKKKNKAELSAMVQRQLDKWPAKYGPFSPKTTMDQMKSALLDATCGFTTNASRITELNTLNKSKTAGSRVLAYQKERAVEQAQREGSIKASALAQKLDAQGVDAVGVSVSLLLANWPPLSPLSHMHHLQRAVPNDIAKINAGDTDQGVPTNPSSVVNGAFSNAASSVLNVQPPASPVPIIRPPITGEETFPSLASDGFSAAGPFAAAVDGNSHGHSCKWMEPKDLCLLI